MQYTEVAGILSVEKVDKFCSSFVEKVTINNTEIYRVPQSFSYILPKACYGIHLTNSKWVGKEVVMRFVLLALGDKDFTTYCITYLAAQDS